MYYRDILGCGENLAIEGFDAAADVDLATSDRVELCPHNNELSTAKPCQ